MAFSPAAGRLPQMLQAAVQAVQWTYSLFWQQCPQQGALVWGDGYYNGAIKTRKTVQPMEVTAEEAALQRSQQLRELFESLPAGENNPTARRPSAALSPEDLTESEWFYLMCPSYSFPLGTDLPGKAYARRRHVWLTGANEADSKVFSRAILAKSARIQTVVCIPIMDGVLELGTTDRVQEDLGLIKYAKSFFLDQYNQQQQPKPALSEQSTSNTTSLHQTCFQTSSIPPMCAALHTPTEEVEGEGDQDDEEEEIDDDDEEEQEEEEEETEMDFEGEAVPNTSDDPLQLGGGATHGLPPSQTGAELSELMQLAEMSPDVYSNNLDSEMQILRACNSGGHADPQLFDDSYRVDNSGGARALLPEELSAGLVPSGAPMEELSQEDSLYPLTVSAILQGNSLRWASLASSSSGGCFAYSHQHSAFSRWSYTGDAPPPPLPDGSSQWKLKYVLFTLPFLHAKLRSEENNNIGCSSTTGNKFRKCTPQDELSANHVLAERRRREKLNERFVTLRSLVPFVTKMDKASILGDTIEYVNQLRRKIQDLEARNKQIETGQGRKGEMPHAVSRDLATPAVSRLSRERSRIPAPEKKRMRAPAGVGHARAARGPVANAVEISITESDALLELELQCAHREGLLLDILRTMQELHMEVTAVQSSSHGGVFLAKLKAKVRDKINGRKASVGEVKKAINQVIPQFRA